MSTDMFISQPALWLPATGFQTDRIGSFGLNQSSKTKVSLDSVKDGPDNFLNALKQVTLSRVSNKRLKFALNESSPVTGTPFDVRDMDEASPDQLAPVWKFMAVIEILEGLGFHDATANQTEAGNNDSGLLNFSGQQSEKIVGFSPSRKETGSGQRILRNRTVDQILRKTAIHLRKGQYEAIIDLKSDVLGHIRMQVIVEQQQVAIRILAEHAFVKDMIENNLHQLKADLQQHGLEVDNLEVTVSCDPEDLGISKEKFAQWRAGPGNGDHQKNDDWKDKQQIDNRHPARKTDNFAAIDYFA